MKKTSKSKDNTTQTTSQTDARQVVDGGSLGNTGAGGAVGGAVGLSGGSSASLLDQSITNITDGGIIDSAFKYLTARDVSGAKQVESMLDTSRSAIEQSIQNNAESKTNNTMIYALSTIAAVLVLKGMK